MPNRITVSTFGIGQDFDEAMMSGIAQSGQGDYYFISGTESIEPLVSKGLQGFTSVIGTNTKLQLRGMNGASVKKVYMYQTTDAINLGDLRENDERRFLIELDVKSLESAANKEVDVLLYQLSYDRPNKDSVERVMLEGSVNIDGLTNNATLIQSHRDESVWALETLKTAEERDAEILQLMYAGKREESLKMKQESIQNLESIPTQYKDKAYRDRYRRHADSYKEMMSDSPAAQVQKTIQYASVLNAEDSSFKADF